MNRFLISAFSGAILCGPAALAPRAAAQTAPGAIRVVNAEKGWKTGANAVGRGDILPAGAMLTTQDSGDLTLSCGTPGWLSYSCRSGACRVQACATQAAGFEIHRVDLKSSGIADGAEKLLASLFTREPRTPVMAVTRSTGNPSDALLRQAPLGLHFGPALTRVLEGQYCFRLIRLPLDPARPARTLTLNWDRSVDPEGVAKGAYIAPGTYLLEKGMPGAGGSCALDSESAPAWVVVAPENRFANANTVWTDRQTRLDQLERTGASAALVATLRHAVLASISDTVEGL